jgi:nicotinamide riboside kinase
VRAGLARRVVVIGAESTGKTTLAQALAENLGTVWVPEYGRWYWEGRRCLADQEWDTGEFHGSPRRSDHWKRTWPAGPPTGW